MGNRGGIKLSLWCMHYITAVFAHPIMNSKEIKKNLFKIFEVTLKGLLSYEKQFFFLNKVFKEESESNT